MVVLFPQRGRPFSGAGGCVYAHSALVRELEELLPAEDDQLSFQAQFESRLQILNQHLGREHLFHSAWFEILRDEDFRSMKFHIAKLGNLRILYCIESSRAYLLAAFKEKKSVSDYRRAVVNAAARRKDIEGGSP